MQNTTNQLMPATAAAAQLGISRQWLHILIQKDRINAVRLGHHTYLYEQDVIAYKNAKGDNGA